MPLSIPSRHILQRHSGASWHPDLIHSQRSDAFDIASCDQTVSDQLYMVQTTSSIMHPAMSHIMSFVSLEQNELLNLLFPSVSHIPEPHKVAQIWFISAVCITDAIPSIVSDPSWSSGFKIPLMPTAARAPQPNTYPWLGFAASSSSSWNVVSCAYSHPILDAGTQNEWFESLL